MSALRFGCAMLFALSLTTIQASEIHDAVKGGDAAKVAALLTADPALLNARDETGRTPLHWAARGDAPAILTLLVERGADVSAADSSGSVALHGVASRGNIDGLKLLVAKGANVNAVNAGQKTPLHVAALAGKSDAARWLAANGANLEARDDYQRTALVLASREMAGIDMVRTLLDLGANIDSTDRFGDNALSLAVWRGTADVVDLLLERNAKLPADPRKRQQGFELSVEMGLDALFFRLVREGAVLSPDAAPSLLARAAEGGSVAIIGDLLGRGYPVNWRDENGWTPLHFAVDMGRNAAIELLLAKGAALDARTVMGQTPLNIAEDNRDEEMVAFLASKGARHTEPEFPLLRGEYLGQQKPGRTAVEFAPGIVSARYQAHSNIVFSPDGRMAMWSVLNKTRGVGYSGGRTLVSKLENGRWTYPERAFVAGVEVDDCPFFHPDGGALFDMARRPIPGSGETEKENIWSWSKKGKQWAAPTPLPRAVNDVPQHWQFSVDRKGHLYFATTLAGTAGGSDIYVSRLVKGEYQKPENLGPAINSAETEGQPYVTPDGRTLLFTRGIDIFASFLAPSGSWTTAQKLGPEVNTPAMEILPVLSPDGKYLFFSRGWALFWIDGSVVEESRSVALSRVGKESITPAIERLVRSGDLDAARTRFAAMRGPEAASYFVEESELITLGYALIRERKLAEAKTVFTMATEAFPSSWNAWDSLGEACAMAGDYEVAKAHYAKSVELNPRNENGKEWLSRIRGYEVTPERECREPLRFAPGTNTGRRGPYLGEEPPGAQPKPFAPGIVSTRGAFEFSIAFTPDGKELYFTRRIDPGPNTIMVSRLLEDGWSAPEEAAFSRGFPSNEPCVTPDGRRLYFGSNRPRAVSADPEYGIWFVERVKNGSWSEPRYHGPGMYVSQTRGGDLYMTDITNVAGRGVIVYPKTADGYGVPRRAGGGVNEPRPADHAFVAPDESYVVFDSELRPGSQGGDSDLWVCFRNAAGGWSDAFNLGDAINNEATNFCPALSPDGKYLFYSTYHDIYWVRVDAIDALRARAAATAQPPAPRLLTADTPMTSVAGNSFIAPAGWSVSVKDRATIVEAPEGNSRIVLVDLAAADADAAVAAALAQYGEVKWPLIQTSELPDREGWSGVRAYAYQVPPEEKRIFSVSARKANDVWTVRITDLDVAVSEKRSAQISLLSGALLPKGRQRESFAGRTARKLDAKAIEKLSRFIDEGREKLGVPGVSIGIVQDGKILFAGGFGTRDLDKADKVDADTLYMIASNTKALTTLMLAKLVDAKRLTWDTPVTSVLPGFRLGDDDTTKRVLVKHLICACTGLPRQDLEWTFEFRNSTPATALASLATMQPTSGFGELYQYSNPLAAAGGYAGGHIAYPNESLGAAYDDAMRTSVFEPLGMTSTTFDFTKALSQNHATAHAIDIDGKPARAVMDINYAIQPLRPAGGVWSSVRDLLRYVQMEIDEGALPDGNRYIGADALLARRAPQVAMGKDTTYGMGLRIERTWGVPLVHHGGDLIGYHSDMLWLPDQKVGAVILTNGDSGVFLRGSLQRKLLELMFDGEPRADRELASVTKRYFDALATDRKLLTVPPDPAASGELAARYRNDALGDINVVRDGAKTTFDFGEWRSEVATRREPDGSITFVTISPGITGREFIPGVSGKRTLITRDAQHEYVFVEQ